MGVSQRGRGSGSGPIAGAARGAGGARRRRRARPVASTALVTVVAVVVLIALAAGTTSSLASTVELGAVAVILFGLALAVVLAEPDGARVGEDDVHGREPTGSRAAATLADLDPIEHRAVELGRPWPQLVVGPTGVLLVDVCPTVSGSVELAGGELRDVLTGRSHAGCVVNLRSLSALRAHLAAGGVGDEVPVTAISVVPTGTTIRATGGAAAPGLAVVPVERLADALARGPVLPMATVDRVYGSVARLPALSAPLG